MSLQAIAQKVLSTCFMVKPEEVVVIVTDSEKLNVARPFYEAARKLECQTHLEEVTSKEDGNLPTKTAELLLKAHVALLITSTSYTHTAARAAATKAGCRIASMPRITEKIVKTALDTDYSTIKRTGIWLSNLLSEARDIHVTTALGTDLHISCQGRQGIADTGDLSFKGAFGNLPTGEAMVTPIETHTYGTIVVDGVIAGIPDLREPLRLTVERGVITEVVGKDKQNFEGFLSQYDTTARIIGEFGIGTNKQCQIMNNPLVDEKVFGTVHFGCGNNLFMGGCQGGNTHYDMIIQSPTVYIDGICIIKDGEHIYTIA